MKYGESLLKLLLEGDPDYGNPNLCFCSENWDKFIVGTEFLRDFIDGIIESRESNSI